MECETCHSAMSGDSTRHDLFKQAQLRYRRDASKPEGRMDDLADIVDFGRPTAGANDSRIHALDPKQRAVGARSDDEGAQESNDRDQDSYNGPLYTLEGYDGFLYAPQALPLDLQLQLAYHAVSSYCERPHKTNIELVEPKAFEVDNSCMSMWDLWKQENDFPCPRVPVEGGNSAFPKLGKDRRFYKSFAKLSWATMGYNYDWTARAYHDDDRSPIPADLATLSQYFAAAERRWRISRDGNHTAPPTDERADASTVDSFKPSACIVNYYNSKSIMGGHRDDSEPAVHQPIVSFSMGRPAVFLLGGPTRNDPVTPILVWPGDVMMMGGATRLNYHAMARLLPADKLPPARSVGSSEGASSAPLLHTPVPENELEPLRALLESHRININLRQVYP
jgi:alkylated DNA repair dioxygenase AlkB